MENKELYTVVLLVADSAVLNTEIVTVNYNNLEDAKNFFNKEKEFIMAEVSEHLKNLGSDKNLESEKENILREESEFSLKADFGEIAYALEIRNGSIDLKNRVGF